MTVLGSTVVVNAGVLAGLVMAQLKREGAPYIAIGWAGEALDMRTMVDVFAGPSIALCTRACCTGTACRCGRWAASPTANCGPAAAAEAALTMLADAITAAT